MTAGNKMIFVIFLIALISPPLHAQTEIKTPVVKEKPRFVDRNGDGLNDHAIDLDRDGIPDYLIDKDQRVNPRVRRLWRLYRSMPQAARTDSVKFRKWWESRDRKVAWDDAWNRWQQLRRSIGLSLRRNNFPGNPNYRQSRFANPRNTGRARPNSGRRGNPGPRQGH